MPRLQLDLRVSFSMMARRQRSAYHHIAILLQSPYIMPIAELAKLLALECAIDDACLQLKQGRRQLPSSLSSDEFLQEHRGVREGTGERFRAMAEDLHQRDIETPGAMWEKLNQSLSEMIQAYTNELEKFAAKYQLISTSFHPLPIA